MQPLLEFNIHRNPKCLLIKSENELWNKCIKQHRNDINANNDVITRTCYAGVEEEVFFLQCGGTVCVSKAANADKEAIRVLVNPLCRMIEYLRSISPEPDIEVSDNELVSRIIHFVQRNFYNQISNEDIAKFCSCSVSTVCHLFKKSKGISIRKYIVNLRMNYAKELLRTSSLSITVIAQKCGFSDYNYFAVSFKSETGISPSEYRKTHAITNA